MAELTIQNFGQYATPQVSPVTKNTGGFLGNMVKGIFNVPIGMTKRLSALPEMFTKTLRGDDDITFGNYKPTNMTQNEYDNWMGIARNDQGQMTGQDMNASLYRGAKDLAGIASFAVPGGVGWRGVGQAALSGGLGAIGATESNNLNEIIKNAATGSLFGAGTGAVLQGVGKAFNKMGNKITPKLIDKVDDVATKGELMQARSRGLKFDTKSPDPFGDLLLRNKGIDSVASKYGINPNNFDAKSLSKLRSGINSEIDDILRSQPGSISIDGVLDDLTQEVADLTGSNVDVARRLLNKRIKRVTGTKINDLSFQDLAKIKKAYQNMAFRDSTSTEGIVQKSLHDYMDNMIKESVPELKPLYGDLSKLHRVSRDLGKASEKGSYIKSPMVSNISVPTFGVPERLRYGVGNLLKKAGRKTNTGQKAGALSKIINNTLPAGAGASPIIGSQDVEALDQATQSMLNEQYPQFLEYYGLQDTPESRYIYEETMKQQMLI